MHLFPSLPLRQAVVAGAAFAALAIAQAAPVSLSLTGFSFTPGAGYGVDDDEAGGTLLDVVFDSSAFASQTFTLNAGDSFGLGVGSVQLREANAHGGILAGETDGLGLGATLSFTGAQGSQTLTASVSAVIGAVADSATDFTIAWAPLVLDLGNGDLLDIALGTLQFSGAETLTQNATLTLRHNSDVAGGPGLDVGPALRVPEPTSVLLIGVALAALALARGRR